MNFTLKTLVAAVALVAAGSANAYQGPASGNGNLVFVLWDAASNDFMFKSLDSTVDDWTVGAPAVAKPQAANQNFTLDLDTSAAFATFSGDNTNTATWKWAVIGQDDTYTSTTENGGRRVVVTGDSTKAAPAPSATQFAGFETTSVENRLNATTDEFVNIAGGTSFVDLMGPTAKGSMTNGIGNAYNASSSFYYMTGKVSTARVTKIVDTEAAAVEWKFGAGNVLSFTTTQVASNVPESDTYAMLLAGLGVMGMVARRRLAA